MARLHRAGSGATDPGAPAVRVRSHAAAILALAMAAAAIPSSSHASVGLKELLVLTSERVANHNLSGFAVDGFDVVAYFIEGKASPGLPDYETTWNGVVWRFASRANQVAFERDPQIYAPRFGGYDAEAAMRGAPAQADPHVFAVTDGRLYLFRTEQGRARFAADGKALRAGEERWRDIEKQLTSR